MKKEGHYRMQEFASLVEKKKIARYPLGYLTD
jgi:hypothetical protein